VSQFSSIDQVLDYAIARERVAYDFYSQLAGWVKRPETKERLREFALQEKQHRGKLEAVKAGKAKIGEDEIEGFILADIDEEVRLDQYMNYAALLMLAMKREKEAYQFYMRLASAVQAKDLQHLFRGLAQEEASHKLWLELEYDWTRG
jgi:rubrerythrin